MSAHEVIRSNSDRIMGAGDVLGSGGDMVSCDMMDIVTTYPPDHVHSTVISPAKKDKYFIGKTIIG